jgi:hypothetical protein
VVDCDKLKILKKLKKNGCNLQSAIITYSTTNLKFENQCLIPNENEHVASKMDLD